MLRKFLILSLLSGLSACGARTITSDVTRFHELPPIEGQTVAIVAKDASKSGSVEFARHADIVAGQLGRYGFRPAGDAPPDLIALIDYFQRPVGIEDDDGGGRMSVGIGGGSGGRTHVGVGVGTSFDLSGGKRTTTQRSFMIEIDDRETGSRVFEGRAQSTGPAENFLSAMPYMIDALFDGFPGNSGETVTVSRKVE